MNTKKKQYVKLKGKVKYFMPSKRSSFSTEQEPKYEITLCNIEEYPENTEALTMLDAMGTKIRQEGTANDTQGKYTDRGRFVTSSSQFPIGTLDAQKKPIPEDLGIGNDSEVIAVFEVYPSKGAFNFALGIRKVQIINLVPYEQKESKEDTISRLFDEEDGFVAPETADEAAPAPEVVAAKATESVDLDDEIPF